MSERKDYYKILGVTDEEKKLTGEEFNKVLKPKFRSLALSLHPDRQQGKSDEEKKAAEEKFKEVSEAYEVLSDEKKRAEYDNPASNFQFSGFDDDADFHDFIRRHFSDFGSMGGFGFDPFNMGFGEMNEPQVVKGNSIRVKIALSLEEVYSGVKKKIRYKRREICDNCGGSGLTKDSKKVKCKTCGGNGMVIQSNGIMTIQRTCPTCGGKGYYVDHPCGKCNGLGVIIGDFETDITINKGILPGSEITFPNLGHAAPHGNGVNGDLIVFIYEKPHEKFQRDGYDLYFRLNVPVLDAIMGCDVTVDTIDGKTLAVKIPQGSNEGDHLRIVGHGLPYPNGGYGNMVGVVTLIMPSGLNKNEIELINKLRKEEHFK